METALFLRSSASPLEPKVSGARVSGPVGEYCFTGRGEGSERETRKEGKGGKHEYGSTSS